jgi:hypothetical protein
MWGDPDGITEENIEKRIARGYGQGVGTAYVPWIQKHDFGSKGTAKEFLGIKIPRSHHLLSLLEYKIFLPYEFSKLVVDIREQFPLLDRELVVKIARQIGCKIPYYSKTRTVRVLTTDLLLTEITQAGYKLSAISIKPSSELEYRRIRELLEIERRYWNAFKIEWKLLTEKEVNENLWRNLRWLRQQAVLNSDLSQPELNDAFLYALGHVSWSGVTLKENLSVIAKCINLSLASSVALFKFNTWHCKIQVDLLKRIELTRPISSLIIQK